jgi:hypothetical protein
MESEPSTLQAALKEATRSLTSDSLEKMRAVSLAGTGACTALMLFILQDAELRRLADLPLFFACTGMPVLLASGFMVENYLFHGESSYKGHMKKPASYLIMFLVFATGGACLVLALFFLLREFHPSLAWYFAGVMLMSFCVVLWHNLATKPAE